MSYKQILVGIDLTEEADEVLAAARSVADEQNAKLTSLTVVKPLVHVYGSLDMALVTIGSLDFEKEAVKQALAQLSEMSAKYGIKADNTKVCLGSPAIEIRTLAEELEADLIVIGTHGRHGLGLLLGSTANAVLHGVHCDVLAVKIHPLEES
jgi:universal stress protein A